MKCNKSVSGRRCFTKEMTAVFQGLLLLMLSVVSAAGCNVYAEDSMTDDKIQKITYNFTDASVPPEYHRSFSITVTADKVRIVVDSYGDILADREYEITNKQFDAIRKSLKKNKIGNCSLSDDKGCTGGTVEKVSFSDGKKEIFSGSVYHCGRKDTGDLS